VARRHWCGEVFRRGMVQHQEGRHLTRPVVSGAGGRGRTGAGLVDPRDFKCPHPCKPLPRPATNCLKFFTSASPPLAACCTAFPENWGKSGERFLCLPRPQELGRRDPLALDERRAQGIPDPTAFRNRYSFNSLHLASPELPPFTAHTGHPAP
jgi:hypothetical protein